MKKILAIALSALLLMTVCATLASADAGLAISVAKAEAAAGEDVAVDFVVDSNSGFWGLSLDVTYDTSVLTLKSVDFADAFKAEAGFLPVEAGAEKFTINASANSLTDNITTTGTLATATFTVAADAAEGAVADINVTFKASNQIDVDMNDVPTTVNAGSVTVKAAEPSVEPSEEPSVEPSEEPVISEEPIEEPTDSEEPIEEPTDSEEPTPIEEPTDSEEPTEEPSEEPATDATTTTTTAAPADTTSPDTGSALPIAAIVLAAGSAAVLTFARKK